MKDQTSPLRFLALIVLLLSAILTARAGAADIVVTYRVTNQHQQVTVKNGAGKTLLTKRAATPTLQAIIAFHKPTVKDAPPDVQLTLEDTNGHALWAVPITAPPGPKPLHSMQFTAKSDNDTTGTLFTFTFSATASSDSSDTDGDDKTPKSMSVVCAIGADGRLTSMNAQDSDGKKYQAVIDPKHMTITGPDGQSAQANLSGTGGADGQVNGTMEINGTKISITTVKRDGKQYLSFPWNGHQVFVEQGCTFTVNADGDLTVNAPAKTPGK